MAYTPEQIKTVLAAHGLSPNRALGQNFCTDGALLREAVRRAGFAGEPVLEIGPGLGALTAELLSAGCRVTAVEKDAAIALLLPELLPDAHLTVCTADIQKTDVPALFPGTDFSAAGNLPYYITTPIAEQLLPLLPRRLLLMVQKEAAARFFALPGDRVYGPVAVLSQTYYRPEKLTDVPPAAYWPRPEVDSAIVLLTRREKAATAVLPAPGALLKFTRAALASRRKTLVNNFRGDERLPATLAALGLPANVRAEALSPAELAGVCGKLDENAKKSR